MRRRIVLSVAFAVGLSLFILSRTVWGPKPARAAEAAPSVSTVSEEHDEPRESEAAWRHRTNQPRHWRYIMLRR